MQQRYSFIIRVIKLCASIKSFGVKPMFDISIELSTTQDGLVFLLVHFLFESFLFPLKE